MKIFHKSKHVRWKDDPSARVVEATEIPDLDKFISERGDGIGKDKLRSFRASLKNITKQHANACKAEPSSGMDEYIKSAEGLVNKDVPACKTLYGNDQYSYFMDTLYGEDSHKRRFTMEDSPLGLTEFQRPNWQRKCEERRLRNDDEVIEDEMDADPAVPDTTLEEEIYRDFILTTQNGKEEVIDPDVRGCDPGVLGFEERHKKEEKHTKEDEQIKEEMSMLKKKLAMQHLRKTVNVVADQTNEQPRELPPVPVVPGQVVAPGPILKCPGVFLTRSCHRWFAVGLAVLVVVSFSITCCGAQELEKHLSDVEHIHNCTSLYPDDFMDPVTAAKGGFVVSLLIAAYFTVVIIQVADQYFVPSVEVICEDLGLQSNVAGALFMGSGTSLVNIMLASLAVTKEFSMGTKTIASTTMLRMFLSLGLSGLLAGYEVPLFWYPLARDMIFYFLALALLLLLSSNIGHGLVGIFMLILYFDYLLVMYYNKKIQKRFLKMTDKQVRFKVGRKELIENDDPKLEMVKRRGMSHYLKGRKSVDRGNLLNTAMEFDNLGIAEKEGFEMLEQERNLHITHWSNDTTRVNSPDRMASETDVKSEKGEEGEEGEEGAAVKVSSEVLQKDEVDTQIDLSSVYEDHAKRDLLSNTEVIYANNPFEKPNTTCRLVMWVISLPFAALHFITIPDCRKILTFTKKGSIESKLYFVTFTASSVFMMVYTYIILWMTNNTVMALGIPGVIHRFLMMSFVLSIPCIYCSVTLTRDGYGDLAVSNAIGGNVFAILIGMGVPFVADFGNNLPHDSHSWEAHVSFITALLFAVICISGTIHVTGWTLNWINSLTSIVMFLLITISQLALECTVFDYGDTNKCSVAACDENF